MTQLDMMEQLAHIGWGALIFDALGARFEVGAALGIVTGFALAKEVVFESIIGWPGQPLQPWPKCFEDLAFWGVGIALGFVIWRLDL